MFNENLVLGFDLKTQTTIAEVKVPAPNDVVISPDGKLLYAACGSWLGKIPIAAGRGEIWKIEVASQHTPHHIGDDQSKHTGVDITAHHRG